MKIQAGTFQMSEVAPEWIDEDVNVLYIIYMEVYTGKIFRNISSITLSFRNVHVKIFPLAQSMKFWCMAASMIENVRRLSLPLTLYLQKWFDLNFFISHFDYCA